MQNPPTPFHLKENECALSLGAVENLGQGQKSERTRRDASERREVLASTLLLIRLADNRRHYLQIKRPHRSRQQLRPQPPPQPGPHGLHTAPPPQTGPPPQPGPQAP